MIVWLMLVALLTTVAGALYANVRITESALKGQQLNSKRLTDLTRQLALLNKASDVIVGQGAIEVDRQNTVLLEQAALRLPAEPEPTPEPFSPPKRKIVQAGAEAFELVGATPEEEREFLDTLKKEN